MPTEPSQLPTWATAAGSTTEPASARKTSGWTAGSPPPSEEVNWWWNLVYLWIAFFQESGAGSYDSLPDALAAIDTDEYAQVDEDDRASEPGSVAESTQIVVGYPLSIDCDGDRVVYLMSNNGAAYAVESRWAAATLATTDRLATYTITQAWANGRRIITTGFYVAIAYDQYVDIFLVDGTQTYTIDHGAQVEDICSDGQYLFIVGAQGTGTAQVRAVSLATGIQAWAGNHGGTGVLYSCATDGRRLVVAGAASTSGSAATIRCLEAVTGKDAAGELGIGTSTYPDVWDLAGQVTDRGHTMAIRDGDLWIGYPAAATHQLERRSILDGTLLSSWDSSLDLQCLAVDDGLVVAGIEGGGGGGDVFAFDRRGFPACRWAVNAGGSGTLFNPQAVATDGFAVHQSVSTVLSDNIIRQYRGNRPGKIRRINTLDRFADGGLVYTMER